jgi:hypothetical protein
LTSVRRSMGLSERSAPLRVARLDIDISVKLGRWL